MTFDKIQEIFRESAAAQRRLENQSLAQMVKDTMRATKDEIEASIDLSGADKERARILAALEEIRPMEEPYTRLQWAWEQRGAKDMFAKVMKAIEPK